MVEAFLRPDSFVFRVVTPDGRSMELSTPLPAEFQTGAEVAFCLCYDHQKRQLKTFGAHSPGDEINGVDLGFIEGRQVSFPTVPSQVGPNFVFLGYYVHDRELPRDELSGFSSLFIEVEPAPRDFRLGDNPHTLPSQREQQNRDFSRLAS